MGDEPHSLAQAPDGTIWVANQMSDEVVVIDPNTFAVLNRIALPYASQPVSVAFGAKGVAYVSLFATGNLVEIDVATRKVGRAVSLGPTPYGISVASDGRIFVTRFISPATEGQVWVVSPDSFTLKKTISLATDQGPDTESRGRGVPNFVASIAISPDGQRRPGSRRRKTTRARHERDGLPYQFRELRCAPSSARSTLQTRPRRSAGRIDLEQPVELGMRSRSSPSAITPTCRESTNQIEMYDAYSTLQIGTGINNIGGRPTASPSLTTNGRLYVQNFPVARGRVPTT